MHDQDRSRAVGDRGLDRRRIEIERIGPDIGEHRGGAHARDRLGGRKECVRSGYDLVAGTHTDRLEGQQQRVGAVGDADSVGGAELDGHLLLEPAHLWAQDETAGVDHVSDGLLDVGQKIRVLPVDVHERDRHCWTSLDSDPATSAQ